MNRYLFSIYRVVVPKPFRTYFLKKSLRRKILRLFSSLPPEEVTEEQKEVLEFIRKDEVRIFPYPFHFDYSPSKIEVFHDDGNGMKYVVQNGKRLYFKKRWSEQRIKKAYCDLMREQDMKSPHRYLTGEFKAESDDVVADIGAAEGNFSLDIIDTVKKVYLFEYDREWDEALRATFAPWAGKVEIINKYVSDRDDERHIRFDTFFEKNHDVNFFKIDVDGAEAVVLKSFEKVFELNGPFKMALCTYHKNHDERDFTEMLRQFGFRVNPSRGYMIHYYDKQMKAPYLRRGLLRATK